MIWSLIPSIAGAAITAMNKPKKSDYKVNTDAYKRYIASLRGRQTGSEVYHMTMQPAMKNIGKQTAQAMSHLESSAARHGTAGSGIATQAKLSAHQNALGASTAAHDKATQAQQRENYSLDKSIDYATLRQQNLEARGDQAYNRAKNQWQRNLTGSLVNLGANTAGAIGQGIKQNTSAYLKAKSSGLVPEKITRDEFLKQAKDAGYKGNMAHYMAALQQKDQEDQHTNLSRFFEGDIDMDMLKNTNPNAALNIQKYNWQQAQNLRDDLRGNYTPEQLAAFIPAQEIPGAANGKHAPGDLIPEAPSIDNMDYNQLLEMQSQISQHAARAEAQAKAQAAAAENAPNPILQQARQYHVAGDLAGLQNLMKTSAANITKEDYNQLRNWENGLTRKIDRQTAIDEKTRAKEIQSRKQAVTYEDKADEFRQRVQMLSEDQSIPTDLAAAIPADFNKLPEDAGEIKTKIIEFIDKIDFKGKSFDFNGNILKFMTGLNLSPVSNKYDMYYSLSNYIDELYASAYPDYDPVAKILE